MLSNPEEIIVKYLSDQASTEEIECLNNWLSENEQNMELFCQMQKIWDSKKQMTQNEINQGWKQLYSDIFRNTEKKTPVTRTFHAWGRYAAAVIIGFVIASGWYVMHGWLDNKNGFVNNVVYNNHDIQEILLPDSTVLWLHAGSKITYPEPFNNNLRMVSLEGKAFFDVKKEINRPFLVRSGNVDIQVTGTEFEVKAFAENDISVALLSGGVSVSSKDKSNKEVERLQLVPGQQAIIGRNDGHLHLNEINIPYYLAWKDGTYRFTDEPIENIVELLSQKYNIGIHISQDLKSKRFTGRIISGQNIRDVMEMIRTSYPIHYEIVGSEVFLSGK